MNSTAASSRGELGNKRSGRLTPAVVEREGFVCGVRGDLGAAKWEPSHRWPRNGGGARCAWPRGHGRNVAPPSDEITDPQLAGSCPTTRRTCSVRPRAHLAQRHERTSRLGRPPVPKPELRGWRLAPSRRARPLACLAAYLRTPARYLRTPASSDWTRRHLRTLSSGSACREAASGTHHRARARRWRQALARRPVVGRVGRAYCPELAGSAAGARDRRLAGCTGRRGGAA